MTDLFHITERAHWAAAVQSGEYRISTRGVTLDQQGYIHCSLRRQLRGVAKCIYGDTDGLAVLVIDSTRLDIPVRCETPDFGSESFPHIYGSVPTDAVTEVITVERDDSGRLLLPE